MVSTVFALLLCSLYFPVDGLLFFFLVWSYACMSCVQRGRRNASWRRKGRRRAKGRTGILTPTPKLRCWRKIPSSRPSKPTFTLLGIKSPQRLHSRISLQTFQKAWVSVRQIFDSFRPFHNIALCLGVVKASCSCAASTSKCIDAKQFSANFKTFQSLMVKLFGEEKFDAVYTGDMICFIWAYNMPDSLLQVCRIVLDDRCYKIW